MGNKTEESKQDPIENAGDLSGAEMGSAAPTVMCKWFGHKWTYKTKLQEYRGRELWNIKRLMHQKACVRCGQPNPNYEEQ